MCLENWEDGPMQTQGPEFESWAKLSDMDVISPGWEAEMRSLEFR